MRDDCNPEPCNCRDGKEGLPGLKGPKGDQGVTGSQGLEGSIGVQGIQGVKGDDGPIGDQGVDGSDGTSTIVGPAGPTGPQGIQGIDGPDGNDGNDGNDGANGTDACAVVYQTKAGNCSYAELGIPPQQIPCQVYGLGLNSCGWVIMNKHTGTGVVMFTILVPRNLNDRVVFMGFDGNCPWRVGVQNGRIEMAAYNSTTDNITTANGLAAPYFGGGDGVVTFSGGNTGDYVELVCIGDDHFVIVDCNLANDQEPLFT
jgi:hypothetical protein